jgi:hypothetical protein
MRIILWALPITPFDQAIVNRLASLAENDKELAERVRKYFEQQEESKVVDKKLITNEVIDLQKQYDHYEMLINTPMGFTLQKIQGYAQKQNDIAKKIDEAKAELDKLEERQPSSVIPRFYDVLGHIPELFWKQDIDHRRKMLRLLIDNAQIENLSPHIYALCVNWIAPVARRPDTALIYKGSNPRQSWSTAEEEQLRIHYPQGERQKILQLFPDRSWIVIMARACRLGIKREHREQMEDDSFHYELTYNDWIEACKFYSVGEEREKQEILATLNTYADQVKKKELEFLWLLPPDQVAIKAMLESIEGDITTSMLQQSRSGSCRDGLCNNNEMCRRS